MQGIMKGLRFNALKVFVVAAVISIFVSLLAFPAFSETKQWGNSPQDKSNYFVAKAGVFSPQSDLSSYDEGFNGEIAYGHYFHPNFAGEIGIGYFRVDGDDGKYDGKIESFPFSLSAKAVLPLNRFELYALGGLGAYITHDTVEHVYTDDYIAFGVHLGAGANFNITDTIYLGIEGKYVWEVGDYKKDSFTDSDHDINGFMFTGNVGYRF